jgi:small basic protein
MKGRWGCIFLPHNGSFFVNYVITATFVGITLELVRFADLFVFGLRLLGARTASERHFVRQVDARRQRKSTPTI